TIPEELRQLNRWVSWSYRLAGDKWTKVPFMPGGTGRASSTNSTTWRSFQAAMRSRHMHDGVGFVVTGADGFVGIDLDHCLLPDGKPERWAREMVEALNSYTEQPPSLDGLRIWVRGTWSAGHKVQIGRGALEVYSKERYFTVTGLHLVGTPSTIQAR